MRRLLAHIVIFSVGCLCGAFFMDQAHIWSRPKLVSVLQSAVETQEEFLGSRRAREGKLAESLVHRWNAADAWDPEIDRAPERTLKDLGSMRVLPLYLWAVHREVAEKYPNPNPKGRRCYAAHLRRQVVLTLEAFGRVEEARAEAQRIPIDCQAFGPTSFEDLLASENTPLQIEVEGLSLDRP
jgi:hypothetical protein